MTVFTDSQQNEIESWQPASSGLENLSQYGCIDLGGFRRPERIIDGMYLLAGNSYVFEKEPIGEPKIAFRTG